jgi:hypothetical protein
MPARAGRNLPREDNDRDCHFRALAFFGASALSIPLTVSEIVWPGLERESPFESFGATSTSRSPIV